MSTAMDYEAQIQAMEQRYQEALEEIGRTEDPARRKSLTDEMIKLTLDREALETHLGRRDTNEETEAAQAAPSVVITPRQGPRLDRLIWWSPLIVLVIVFVIGLVVGRVIGLSPFLLALPAGIIAAIVTMSVRARLQS